MNTNKTAMPTLTAMPAMPKRAKSKPIHPCACGCGMGTKSTWASGHDGRATGWAIRIERGIITIDGVPENERQGAVHMLAKRGVTVEVPLTNKERKALRKAERKAAATPTNEEVVEMDRTGTEG